MEKESECEGREKQKNGNYLGRKKVPLALTSPNAELQAKILLKTPLIQRPL
jgi:hypothetical protein